MGACAIPPNNTLVKDLFIATHITYDRMEPDTPIRAPTVVKSALSSINPNQQSDLSFNNSVIPLPSATSANPEYAFNTVITTAILTMISLGSQQNMRNLRMSAPPTAAVVVNPEMKLMTVLAPRYAAATIGTVGAADTKAPKVNALRPMIPPFTRCFLGIANGLEDIRPESLRKATIDPVKVMPPNRDVLGYVGVIRVP